MSSDENLKPEAPNIARHCGYDNCKSVFMMLVVLWHTAHFYILETTLLASDNTATGNGTVSSSIKSSLVSHVILRYWLWTEKVAVPGFCFLSGYFGKGFLRSHPQNLHLPQGFSHNNAEQYLQKIQKTQHKEKIRWEKTVSTLLLGPLLWQVISWIMALLSTSWYTGQWPSFLVLRTAANPKLEVWDNLGTWYLFALLLWRTWTSTILSHVRQDKHIPLVLSMVMALLSVHTTFAGPQDMRMRVFYFFPYYTAGLYCHEGTWHRLLAWWGRRFCTEPHYCCRNSSDSNDNRNHNKWKSSEQCMDHTSRLVGCCGMALTILICQVVPNKDDLGWVYSIDNYHCRPHLVFVLQYILAGTAVVSVMLVVKTIRVPLFPFGHANSTLAIYEWHWPLANFGAWGQLPHTSITVTSPSLVQWCFTNLSPLSAALVMHVLCYGICIVVGNHFVWDKALHHVCDPEWLSKWILSGRHQHGVDHCPNGALEDSLPCQSGPSRGSVSTTSSSSSSSSSSSDRGSSSNSSLLPV